MDFGRTTHKLTTTQNMFVFSFVCLEFTFYSVERFYTRKSKENLLVFLLIILSEEFLHFVELTIFVELTNLVTHNFVPKFSIFNPNTRKAHL